MFSVVKLFTVVVAKGGCGDPCGGKVRLVVCTTFHLIENGDETRS